MNAQQSQRCIFGDNLGIIFVNSPYMGFVNDMNCMYLHVPVRHYAHHSAADIRSSLFKAISYKTNAFCQGKNMNHFLLLSMPAKLTESFIVSSFSNAN